MSEPKFGEWQPAGTAPSGEYVMTIDKYGKRAIAQRAYNDNWSYLCGGDKPTHWMPLPPPPKEEWEEAWDQFWAGSRDTPASLEVFRWAFECGRRWKK